MANSSNIETKRLLITPFSDKHLSERYIGWLNNKNLMRYSEQRHRNHTISSCRAYMDSFKNTPHYFWAVEERDNGLGHIGNMNAYVDTHNKVADLGILIGEATARRQGYGLEAWQAIMSFLFNDIGVRKITAGTISANSSMLRLMKRAGMINDGIRSRQYIVDGNEEDVIHMAAFKAF